MKRPLTILEHALLGLLHQRPQTGYDLRKLFAETPLMSFSESPGSIYPALRRLEERRLIRGRIQKGAGMRRSRVYQVSPAGLDALTEWLNKPVSRDDVIRGAEELMLRFAFMDQLLDKEKIVAFLNALEGGLRAHASSLKEHLEAHGGALTFTGRAALEAGIESYQARSRWAKRVIGTIKTNRKRRVS